MVETALATATAGVSVLAGLLATANSVQLTAFAAVGAGGSVSDVVTMTAGVLVTRGMAAAASTS